MCTPKGKNIRNLIGMNRIISVPDEHNASNHKL